MGRPSLYTLYRIRFSLHTLLVLSLVATCILIATYSNPFPDVNPEWTYGEFAKVTVSTYASVAVLITASDIIALWRKHTIVSSIYFDLAPLLPLIIVSIIGLVKYRTRLLVGYILVFGPTVTACTIFICWILQIAAVVFSLALIGILVKSAVSSRMLRSPSAIDPYWRSGTDGVNDKRKRQNGVLGFFVGVPRPQVERQALLRDALGQVIFQHTIFRKHPFESATLAIVRGLIGIILVTGLGTYAFDLLVIQPIKESDYLPIRYTMGQRDRNMRLWQWHHLNNGSIYLDDMAFLVSQYNWGRSASGQGAFDTGVLSRAVEASVTNTDGSMVSCPQSTFQDSLYDQYILLNCSQPHTTALPLYAQITVDYSYSNLSLSSIAADYADSAAVWMTQASYSASPEFFYNEILPSISPFLLLRDVHVRGTVAFGVRRVIMQSWKDITGVGADYTEFDTYSVENLVPDGTATYPANTSSLMFSAAFDTSNTVFQEDYRQYTTLSGLASVGGVFTIIDGLFAMAFGVTLMSIILGGKPLSPFGAAGIFVRHKLRDAIGERYPTLKREVTEGGMASFLKDVAIELDVLDEESTYATQENLRKDSSSPNYVQLQVL